MIFHRGRDTLFKRLVAEMAARGYVDGETVTLVPRFAEGDLSRTPDLAEDLVRQSVDIIVAIGAVGAKAAQNATSRIPIIFAIVLDPVECGLVASLDRPGGNLTGVTNFDPALAFDQLGLLREVVPGLDRVAVLSDAEIPHQQGINPLEQSCERAAAALGIGLEWFRRQGPATDLTLLFREIVERGCRAVQVLEVPANIAQFDTIARLANQARLPAIFPDGWQHDGPLSYGTSLLRTIPHIPPMIALLLAGIPPGNILVRQVRRHHLRANLTAARMVGIDLPLQITARADEIVR